MRYRTIDFDTQLKLVERFPESQYFREEYPKKQIYLHHTVSPIGADGDIDWWIQTTSRIATTQIVDYCGISHQCFSSKYWAWHLGIYGSIFQQRGLPDINKRLNQESIGIEIDSAGPLMEENHKWYMAHWNEDQKCWEPNLRRQIPEGRIQFYPNGFKNWEAFEKYSDEAIYTTAGLLLLWKQRYAISLEYRDDIWDVCDRALKGEGGVFTHNSVRPDKSDCHPQPELIEMLKEVATYR